jgi:transcriptional regulator with XRE-family HTH domain
MSEQHDGSDGPAGLSWPSLREVRAERLLSIRDLARLANVAPSTIYLIEMGRSTPQLSVIRRLATALKVDPHAVAEFRRAIHHRGGLR